MEVIQELAKDIIFGQLRLVIATMDIEEINSDRDKFLANVSHNVETELKKIGLKLINVNITDIKDESGYIEALGKKAASEAVNQARVDVAQQEKLGAIGEAEANKVKHVRVAENDAEADKGRKQAESGRRIFVQGQEAEAIKGENEAKADIADYEAGLAMKQAEATRRGEVAKRQALVEIQKAEYAAEQERLRAVEIVREEIAKEKVEIAAEATAERVRREAAGEADAALRKYQAEAEGVRRVLEAKAGGYQALVASCGGDARAAATFLMVEKIEDIVARQVDAIRNLKIDRVTVWDSGGGGGQQASTTANFISSLVKSLPPLQDIAGMAGVELPQYLGHMKADESAEDRPAPPPPPAAGPKGA